MRTRNQLKQQQQESPHESLAPMSNDTGDRAGKRSRVRSSSKGGKKSSNLDSGITPGDSSRSDCKRNCAENAVCDVDSKGFVGGDADRATGMKQEDAEGSSRNEDDTFDWEDGNISVKESREASFSASLDGGMTIEFEESPSSAQRKPSRRASAEEKELAELVHKVHLLCLLARGRVVDRTCDVPLIQASLLSLLPPSLLHMTGTSNLSASHLSSLVSWFHSYFHIRNGSSNEGSFKTRLALAIETREGTAEEIAALSVALFRALNLMTRFVAVLDVAPLKPDAKKPSCSSQDEYRLDTNVCSLSNNQENPLNLKLPSSNNMNIIVERTPGVFRRGKNHYNDGKRDRNGDQVTALDTILEPHDHQSCLENMDSSVSARTQVSKRKGDIEFELQMEMALSSTAMMSQSCGLGAQQDDLPSSSTSCAPIQSPKKMRTTNHESNSGTVWSRKQGPPIFGSEVYCSAESPSGRWVHVDAANGIIDGEEKVESTLVAFKCPLRYSVAFAGNGAKDVTRRYCKQWYRVAPQRVSSTWWEMVLAPLKDMESSVSDVIRKDTCMKDTSADQEMNVSEVNKPNLEYRNPIDIHSSQACKYVRGGEDTEDALEQLGQVDRLGISNRNAVEDMDLETKALTEPLPTNQLAYRNHHLYVIERWLKKYEILHPKGPILGYCSGNPVFPRSCVKTLQTRQKWFREGLQVRAGEAPAKLVKHSKQHAKVKSLESTDPEGDKQLTMELFGEWQLEQLNLPPAVNGIVPKNERGRVDVWSEKCLPPGTVHLILPRLVPVVRRLGIDFAPAMVGFEFHNGRSVPVFEGIVVCTEFKDAVMEAFAEEEVVRIAAERKKNEAEALSRWFQLLSSVVVRQRLKNSYSVSPHTISPGGTTSSIGQSNAPSAAAPATSLACEKAEPPVAKTARSAFPSSDEHEHVFPVENQSFDEDNSVLTKRCPCGFSILVEEL